MSQSLQIELDCLATTRRVGLVLGGGLPERALCLFFGEMGTGKTTLIKSVCEGLGIAPENVISPTYTIVNIYPAERSVYHVDLFRIEEPEALLEMDRDDWINPAGPTLIEWPRAALPLLEGETPLELHLAMDEQSARDGEPNRRRLRVAGSGRVFGPVFRAVSRAVSRE